VKLREIFIEGTDQSAFTKAQSLRAEIKDLKDFAKHKKPLPMV
jgi:hypothetical protein